ncbi:MAG: class I SAM-dependent methyltransferase [Candidatus Pacebacteria bacterium]|nr:class I SAM-dependent methyltransferase [Candidatus Paceibacterota bacterium]
MVSKHIYAERLYLDDSSIDQKEKQAHIERYLLACRHLRVNFIVLDAACGSGYGTKMIGEKTSKVVGIDSSPEAIQYAQKNYNKENAIYAVVDLNNPLPFSNNSFDSVVCFETIEHLTNQQALLKEFNRILKPGGLLFISCPEADISKKARIKNPYHQKELSKKEFLQMVSNYFVIIDIFGQLKFIKLSLFKRSIKKIFSIMGPTVKKLIKKILKKQSDNFSNICFDRIEKIKESDPASHFVTIIFSKKP